MRNAALDVIGEMKKRDKMVLEQEQKNKIDNSKYNKKYKHIITTDIPKYLHKESKRKQSIVARFRLGNEELSNRYWEKDGRECRICDRAVEETIEHMLESCDIEGDGYTWLDILNEEGRGESWMKLVKNKRKEKQEK